MTLVETMEQELQGAQAGLVQADVAAIEATARLATCREAVDKLGAAVAAMRGETPVEPSAPETIIPQSEERAVRAAMSEQEFNADRKRRQKARQKELDAQNPLALYKCGGCGVVGSSTEQLIEAPSGAPVRLIGCSACGNQTF